MQHRKTKNDYNKCRNRVLISLKLNKQESVFTAEPDAVAGSEGPVRSVQYPQWTTGGSNAPRGRLVDLSGAAEEEVRVVMFVCQGFSQKNGSSFPGDAV